jgi:hypothetical protein
MKPKKKNSCIALLAGLGAIALILVALACLAGLFLTRARDSGPVSRPTRQIVRSGEAKKDLGFQSGNLGGSTGQAAELLKLIEEQSGKINYELTYQTEIDTVLFACNFEKDVLVRIHQQPDDHGSQEVWQGYIMERLQNAAFGSGSLNDTPEGKIPVIRQDF